jgi:hypothetical protein
MDSIILIAQQLSKEGKVPTTALLKARLPKDVPLPAIIQGLKLWKENPRKEIEKPTNTAIISTAENKDGSSLDALLDGRIEQAIAPLISQINQLKIELANLQKQLIKEDKN